MSEKDDCKTVRDAPRSSSSTKSAASEAVRRAAAKFRERLLQRNKCNKGSLRDKIKSAVRENNNNFNDEVQRSSPLSNTNKRGRNKGEGAQTTRDKVTADKRDKKKGKNYPTPRSAREPKVLTEEEIEEVRRRRRVHDTKVGGRGVKGGFKFRKFDRLGSQPGRRRMDRIYSVDDSDEENERELAFGYGNC